MGNSAFELFDDGNLEGAVEAAIQSVKNKPTDVSQRFLLSELFCLAGEWSRADKQMQILSQQDDQATQRANLVRQLIRAEVAREQFFDEGRIPELVCDPDESLRLCLEASVAIRDGEPDQALELMVKSENARTASAGECNDNKFANLRDLDDLTTGFFEVLTSSGKYYWVPFANTKKIEFDPPETVKDLIWRSAKIEVNEGLNGQVYLPVRYAGSHRSENADVVLGRQTEWTDDQPGPVRGIGQKEFLFDEDVISILELKQVLFDSPE